MSHDLTPWQARYCQSTNAITHTHTNAYQQDYSALLHSESFRRLQGKMQVFSPTKGDFHRTRLTHSLEVAQIGRAILWHLAANSKVTATLHNWLPPEILIETICLAHDIGHPPFGHSGEEALHTLMLDFNGFESNAQNIRILTQLEKHFYPHGINLSRRVLLGIIKYPQIYSRAFNVNYKHLSPPKCLYDSERHILDFVLAPFAFDDQKLFLTIENNPQKHQRTLYKSLDCSLMELADDIAYSTHDIEDGISLGFLNKEKWLQGIAKINREFSCYDLLQDVTCDLFDSPHPTVTIKQGITKLINYFVANIYLQHNNDFEHPLLAYNIKLTADADYFLNVLKNIIGTYVLQDPRTINKIAKGQEIIRQIFYFILREPSILPQDTYRRLAKNNDCQHRIICDYISGMTDNFARKTHWQLLKQYSARHTDLA